MSDEGSAVAVGAVPVPPSLHGELALAREALDQALDGAAAPDVPAGSLDRLLVCSPFAAGALKRSPARLAVICDGLSALPVEDRPPDAAEAMADNAFRARLRRYRNTVMLRLVYDSLTGRDALEPVLAATSRLADECIGLAVDQAHRRLAARFGEPRDAKGRPQRLVTLAMGKLGGGELNFSSDVDLIFLYAEGGSTDGARSLGNEEFFARQVRDVVGHLDERTAEGFVFRVDTRLRPFGLSGAPVQSFAAFEAYLQGHARDWERYAYVRARPVTGFAHHRAEVQELIRPFVYRRYLDYSVLTSVRDIRGRIAAEAQRRDARDDLKIGVGGIREVEFVVQTYQVLHGGRDRAFRRRATLDALAVIVERELISAAAGQQLREAYRLLRHTENAVQMVRDAQTHRLPDEAQERDRIACHLGLASREALAGELSRMRSRVVAQFAAAVVGEAAGAASPDGFQDLVEGRRGRAELVAWLSAQGLRDADELAQMLESMHAAGWYTRLTQAARARLQELLPRCLAVAAALDADAQTMRRVLDVLAAVGSRSVYFALLSENRQALEHLLRVCRMGPMIAEQLVRTPALLDALVDPALLAQPPAPADLRDDLERQLGALPDGDEEGRLDAMRYFQRQALFQIGVADLLDLIDVSQVSDLLTTLAELLLTHALSIARGQLDGRYGRPRDERGDPVPFTIFAYGKLGGRELGYGSDLDVVFLHGDAPGPTDGDRSLDGEVYFRRLAQRVIHVLSTQTGAGSLYQVDTRLRPSGNAGLLVTSLSAFATYQQSEAWTWEHQALLRARPVAGDAALCERVEAVRRRVLCQPREREALRRDVLAMRERMRSAAGTVASPGCFDLKRDPGGLVDLEFIVQYLVLARARQHPQLVEGRDNASQLRLLGALGVLDPLQADALAQAYHRLRGLAHRAALRGEARPMASLDEARDAAVLISAAFARIFEVGDASG